MATFRIKPTVEYGENAFECLKKLTNQKIFIVTDPFMVESGMIDKVTSNLNNTEYKVFSDVVPDPPVDLVVKGVDAIMAYMPNVVIALGGGSAIDEAKAIMSFAKKIGNFPDIMFIAIPTTSGTGSEVTSFAVITDREKGVKYPLVSDDLLPDIAILSTDLVKSVPKAIVADTGMDVLTHSIEAYVSTNASDFSDAFAEKAVKLVFEYLKRSYTNAEDVEAKDKMHIASCLAGLSFNLASLGANHAIAHNIGGKLHIPHGRTNAILLPHIIEFNAHIEGYSVTEYSCAAKKYAQLAKLIGINSNNTRTAVKSLIVEIKKLAKDINIPTKLTECKVSGEEIDKAKKDIAVGALADACMLTNPCKLTQGDIIEIINKIK